jgi:hypothetical protein
MNRFSRELKQSLKSKCWDKGPIGFIKNHVIPVYPVKKIEVITGRKIDE